MLAVLALARHADAHRPPRQCRLRLKTALMNSPLACV
jgi:hypothetical protein